MNTILDIIGSIIIGTLILLMVFSYNQRTDNVATEVLRNNISQYHLIASTELLEYDFYKIGFMTKNEEVFVVANENEIKFHSDIDNDNSVDSVQYIYDYDSPVTSTPNPNDRPLFRKVNNGNQELVAKLTYFNINYLDSIGIIIPHTDLAVKANREKIKSIEVSIKYESDESFNGKYESTEWSKIFTPKSL